MRPIIQFNHSAPSLVPALISIVIPCFNSARWIAAAVGSALEQTWPTKEVLVVDDGSVDSSRGELAKFGDRITLLATPHHGGNHARNVGLARARGEWVQFLDADDYLEPTKVEQQLAETGGGVNADLIYSPTWVEKMTGGRTERSLAAIDVKLDPPSQWLTWQFPQTGGALWRRDSLLALGGWKEDQPCCQEHELYFRAMRADFRTAFAPAPHAVYRIWSEQTVCRRDPRGVIREKTALIDLFRAWMQERGSWQPHHRQFAARACFEMARTLAQFDVAEGVAYHDERRARHLIELSGPAAPRSYRLVYHAAGFARAEMLAALRR